MWERGHCVDGHWPWSSTDPRTKSKSGQYAPLMLFDCRGYEPMEFAFGSGWKVESMDDDDERITDVRGRL
ncbi:hypothetical protein RHMOL_Rhmol13G0217600 [Rhododendron molle]|uniref:Uncharacterized protein n=3 Tax=Rhododendron molle TaxID=49168 RepID=A0ACC0L9Q6_RHOML|nr:hypothetical protein RHMOL_Rhmol13G0217600 [Rhododendron molle]KAI8525269.1 hypothetical protein RHMOL_Rhmol13G0217600 [Rhododendron molle]KAI8525270.1 hypothetical protein RHMOL_Rhmol13G0217600 [Rhododendron molle]